MTYINKAVFASLKFIEEFYSMRHKYPATLNKEHWPTSSYQKFIFAIQADDWTGGDLIMDQMGQQGEDLHEKRKYEELEVKIYSDMRQVENHLSNDHSSIKHLAATQLNEKNLNWLYVRWKRYKGTQNKNIWVFWNPE